ncbi:MAG: response regulator, partial [Desulfomonilaceae bacterium]
GIVTSHGGSVSVNSKLGCGSTFTITIPLSVTDKDDIPQDELDLPIDSSLRFLVIDDDQMLLALFEEALTSLGQRVRTASSGEKALSLLQEEDFDVITCDLGMPHMNGWEVGKRIRKAFEKSVKSKPPLILLTGWGGQMSETDKMLESGIDSILEKPVDITELIAVASGLVSIK